MHEEKPAVVRLQVHKEDEQMVTWNNEVAGNLQQVLENQGHGTPLSLHTSRQSGISRGTRVAVSRLSLKVCLEENTAQMETKAERLCNWSYVLLSSNLWRAFLYP